jgi:hypothetical protein
LVDRNHDPFASAGIADIEIAVVCIAAELVASSGQLLVKIVKHEIAEDG